MVYSLHFQLLFFQHYDEIHPNVQRHQYRCLKCHYHNKSFWRVKAHTKSIHKRPTDEHPLKCDDCLKPFFFEEALAYHCRTKHDEEKETYNCFKCDRIFYVQSTQIVHETLHKDNPNSESEIYSCNYCPTATFSISELGLHHQEHHQMLPLPWFFCTICDYHSKKIGPMENHLRKEHDIREPYKPYKCKHCEFASKEFEPLRKHILSSGHRDDHECKICGKRFPILGRLHFHLKRIHLREADETEIIQCSYCGQTFDNQKSLECHLDVHHPGIQDNKHTCEKCGKNFMFESTYKRHSLQHKAKERREPIIKPKDGISVIAEEDRDTMKEYVKCKFCGLEFHKKHILRHCRKDHPESIESNDARKKVLHCSQCIATFSTEIFLARHEYVVHGIQRHPNVCEKCKAPYKTTHKKCLARKKAERCACEFCGKLFANSTNKRDHIKAFHLNIRSEKCDKCDKSFITQKKLREHITQSHSKQTCPHCQKTIHNAFFLKRHFVFDHGITDGALFCAQCPKKVFFNTPLYEKHLKSHKN